MRQKALILRSKKDFNALFSKGKRYHRPHFSLIVMPKTNNLAQVAFMCFKKEAKAVLRNKVKRRFKPIYFKLCCEFGFNHDIVLVGKRKSLDQDHHDLFNELRTLFINKKLCTPLN